MNPLYAALLGTPVFVLIAWGTLRRWGEFNGAQRFVSTMILIIFTMAAIAAYYPLNLNVIYGVCHYLVVVASSIVFLVGIGYDKIRADWPALLLLFPFIVLIVAIPVAILPQFGLGTTEAMAPPSEISTKPIIESFDRIKEALQNAESQLSIESRNIDTLTAILIREIEVKNSQLRDIRTELQSVRKELEHYKELASLTEEQAQAVINAMRREKYVDYLVGFGIGIITGGMLFFIQRISSRKY